MRKVLLIVFSVLFLILLVILVSFLVRYFLEKGEVPLPGEGGEFPPSPASNFPPPPPVITIGGYYFNEPLLLQENNIISQPAVYAVLCKNNGDYDIMYIGETSREDLSRNSQSQCWSGSCEQTLYLAIFWTPKEKYDSGRRREIKAELEEKIKPPCPVKEK